MPYSLVVHKVTQVKALQDYKLELRFEDGKGGVVDLSRLAGKGVFAVWNDYKAFERVRIGGSGELVWNDQIDLCPDSLYLQATGQRAEDVFPALESFSSRLRGVLKFRTWDDHERWCQSRNYPRLR